MPAPVEDASRADREGAEYPVAEGEAPVGRGNRSRSNAVDEDRGQWKRRNASVPLVPPKPNELESAASIFISRAVFGT